MFNELEIHSLNTGSSDSKVAFFIADNISELVSSPVTKFSIKFIGYLCSLMDKASLLFIGKLDII